MTITGSVDGLSGGVHACLTFSDAEERLDIVSAFVGRGLDLGHKVLCLTDSEEPAALLGEFSDRGLEPEELARSGQLVISPAAAWWADGPLRSDTMVGLVADQVDQAKSAGYPGLWLSADMCWAMRPMAGLDQLAVFEQAVNALFTEGRLTAICQYDRHGFDAVTLATVARSHDTSVAAATYHDDALLRLCRQHRPPGLRAAGELDFTRLEPLNRALGESLRLDRSPYFNLKELRFMDVPSANAFIAAACRLTEEQSLTVVCQPRIADLLTRLGLGEVPRTRLVTHAQR